jgi:hypothetical protein
MGNIKNLDPNLGVNHIQYPKNVVFRNCLNSHFELRGLADPKELKKLCRVSKKIFPLMSNSLRRLSKYTAGGRIRFRTNSPYIIVEVELMPELCFAHHMPATGTASVDVFTGSGKNSKFRQTIICPNQMKYEGICNLKNEADGILEDITLNLPLYNGVNKLRIGLKKDSIIEAPLPYSIDKPVVYYGSSITQGGCASRPSNSYSAIVSRWLDCDHINLGFSGNGFGELFIAEYIAGLDMSACVIDAFNIKEEKHEKELERINAVHEPFFKAIRTRHLDLPIIIISSPYVIPDKPEHEEYRTIIEQTYINAVKAGDRNTYYIDGKKIYGSKDIDACTVDGTHPNDLGFMRIAETIHPVLKKALKVT